MKIENGKLKIENGVGAERFFNFQFSIFNSKRDGVAQ
jgi:hypothetical protein